MCGTLIVRLRVQYEQNKKSSHSTMVVRLPHKEVVPSSSLGGNTMSTNQKFVLTKAHKLQGFTLIIVWSGGTSLVTTGKEDSVRLNGKPRFKVQKVQKLVQSQHHISAQTILHWLHTPSSGWKSGEWNQRSETARIQSHLADFIHDQKTRGSVVSWYIG